MASSRHVRKANLFAVIDLLERRRRGRCCGGQGILARDCTLTIAYDSEGLPGYETGWGFSLLVASGGRRVLFDCGWDGHVLKRNLGRLGVSFADIDKVVISHSHWDHLSGLATVLSERLSPEMPEVFVPASLSRNLRKEISKRASVVEVESPTEVAPGVLSTGELGSDIKEQSLLVVEGDQCVIITGCAHPGIDAIVESARRLHRPNWLIGGFHGAAAEDIPRDLERVVVCHCTRNRTAILSSFRDSATVGRVGESFSPFSGRSSEAK
jgi:7,8-dihydropterin-6-yl-methyl-4-(beta-D-ribofuranosyl)aminobenzene 5'-phosphate synthase